MSDHLLRIEYKLDLIISALQDRGLMLPPKHLPQLIDSGGDLCPVCEQPIRMSIDLKNECCVRSCQCVSPIKAVQGISALLTPPPQPEKQHGTDPRRTEESSDLPLEAPSGSVER